MILLLLGIVAVVFYTMGSSHAKESAAREAAKLENAMKQELIDLRKWKADHIV